MSERQHQERLLILSLIRGDDVFIEPSSKNSNLVEILVVLMFSDVCTNFPFICVNSVLGIQWNRKRGGGQILPSKAGSCLEKRLFAKFIVII